MYFKEALVNLSSAKLRSFLAILGVLVGTAAVVALISSSQLATQHALAQFKKLGTHLLAAYISDDQQSTSSDNQTRQFHLSDTNIFEKFSKQISEVAPYTMTNQSLYFNGHQLAGGNIVGVTSNFQNIIHLELKAGRFISALDTQQFFCVLGNTLAEKTGLPADELIGKQIRANSSVFTVVGVLQKWPRNFFVSADVNTSILVPIETTYLLSKETNIRNLLIHLNKHADIDASEAIITTQMKKILPKKKLLFVSPKQIVDVIAKQRATYSGLLIAIGCISLIVGGIGVMNIMLVSVIERRREIGIRMAVGARQRDILSLFLIEATLLTTFGGLVGALIGELTSYTITIFMHWEFNFYVIPVILGLVVSVLVGILSGFYPALRASHLNPIETLTSE